MNNQTHHSTTKTSAERNDSDLPDSDSTGTVSLNYRCVFQLAKKSPKTIPEKSKRAITFSF